MRYKYLGHCVIVNNVAEETPETRQEVADLEDACKTVGFDVAVHEDLTREVHFCEQYSKCDGCFPCSFR